MKSPSAHAGTAAFVSSPAVLGVSRRTSGIGAKPSAVSAVEYRGDSAIAARRTSAACGADHFRLAHLRFRL